MTVLNAILIVLSFLAGVYCIHRLRRLDIHEQEPFWKMAATVVFGGIRPDDSHAQLETLSKKQADWVESQWWYRK